MHSAWYINIVLGVLLQSLLLWRGLRCRLWRHYPFFYIYLTYTTFWSVVLSLPPMIRHSAYAKVYWWSQLLAATLRFGIAAEIYRHVFPRNSPLRGKAGTTILFTLMFTAFVYWIGGAGPGHYVYLDALRKIALSVATWILVVLGLAHYYGIRIGRNMWGMAVGLLTFTGSELVHLAAMDLLPRWWAVWRYVHPIAFVFMLTIWTSALWRYHPNPRSPSPDNALAREFLFAWQDRWAQVSNILRRVVKP